MSELKQKKIQDILSKYRRAGEISIGAKKLAKKIIKPGVNIWEAGEKIENFIIENGAYPAF
ncbi:type I methionyl aminopeptidase, partial [archaeon]|nr:type I methionyl aminopeptidase [archaeon]NDF28307.1 type I methionyl aminopeptidase [archaeon]